MKAGNWVRIRPVLHSAWADYDTRNYWDLNNCLGKIIHTPTGTSDNRDGIMDFLVEGEIRRFKFMCANDVRLTEPTEEELAEWITVELSR